MKLLTFVALLAASILSLPAQAATAYPTKPIRIIVSYPPGGATDILARLVSPGPTPAISYARLAD